MDLAGKHVHFIGIGGIGVSALARMAQERGAVVSGCDLRANRTTRALEAGGIRIALGHDAAHLAGADIVVHSSAIPPHNPELLRAASSGIEVYTRQRMLGALMRGCRAIGVAGAHGKTTTTWLVANLLIEADLDPTVMVGGMVPALKSNFRLGMSDWFVAEVDESDRLLLELEPTYAILLNIDWEHVDHYADIDDVERVFERFLANTRPDGFLIGCIGYHIDRRVVFFFVRKNIVRYRSELTVLDSHPCFFSHFTHGTVFKIFIAFKMPTGKPPGTLSMCIAPFTH